MKYHTVIFGLVCCLIVTLSGTVPHLFSQEVAPPQVPPTTPATEPPPASEQPASEQPAPEQPTPETASPVATQTPAPAAQQIPKLQFPPEQMTFPLSVQVLGYDTYSQLAAQQAAQGDGNFCFSPQLLAKQLTALRFGADGQTATEVLDVFPARAAVPQTAEFLRNVEANAFKIREGAQHPQTVPTFGQANAVWVPTDHPIVEQYIKDLKTGLSTDLYAADFKNQRDAAATVVNAWARDMTGGRVTSIFVEPYEATLPGEISIVTTGLACAAPRLAVPFNRHFSGNNEFQLLSGEKINVPMMRQIGQFFCAANNDLQVLIMPCVEENLRLVVLLPAQGQLKMLEKSMTPEFLGRWFGQVQPMNVDVIMPQVRTTACFDLTDPLKNMGLSTMTTDKADFSNMSQADEKGPLFLSKFMHETQMTIVEQINDAGQQVPQAQAKFYVNRPFVFMLWNSASGTPLVIGRVTNPQQ